MQKHIKILIFFVLLFVSCEKDTSIYPDIVFAAIDYPAAVVRACGTAFTINDKAYVMLGRKKTSTPLLKDCWEFDPTNNDWTEKQNFPGDGRVSPISAVVGNKAFVGLGYNQGGVYKETSYLRDFWMYDPAMDEWTRKADHPSSSTNNAISFVYNDEIYVAHAFETNGFSRECWKYTPATDTWKQLADFPGRWRSCAVSCTDGLRFFSGTGYATHNRNDWWEYFPTTDTWIKKENYMPDKGRINALAFSINHRFFVATGRYFGGEHTGGHLKSDFLEYNPVYDKWIRMGNLPGGGRENAISFVLLNKVYIGFGENEKEIMNDLWCFEP